MFDFKMGRKLPRARPPSFQGEWKESFSGSNLSERIRVLVYSAVMPESLACLPEKRIAHAIAGRWRNKQTGSVRVSVVVERGQREKVGGGGERTVSFIFYFWCPGNRFWPILCHRRSTFLKLHIVVLSFTKEIYCGNLFKFFHLCKTDQLTDHLEKKLYQAFCPATQRSQK